MNYDEFIERKSQFAGDGGFEPLWLPDFLFPFQRSLDEWAIRKGRAAIFADCGLGKTPMQLVWAQNVVMKTNKPVLILTPLAVGSQTVREGEKFGIECKQSRDGSINSKIVVTNYQQLHKFDWKQFGGVVCDESSILKNFDGAMRGQVTEFMRRIPYRLLCTATAAPNDYIELGTSSEALGYLRRVEMLAHYFNHDGGDTGKWRLKKHAAKHLFWQWLCVWARAVTKPSDLGFDDSGFDLPRLITVEHTVRATTPNPDFLFDMPAVGLAEQRSERRRTIDERCETAASIIAGRPDCSIAWCHLNQEGDMLEKMIPNSVQVSGDDSDEWKELAVEWFVGNVCICGLTKAKLRAKLASCGSQNTPRQDATNISLTNPKDSDGSCKEDHQRQTPNICGTTTNQTLTNSGVAQSSKPRQTSARKSNTHPAQRIEEKQEPQLKNGNRKTQRKDLPNDSSHSGLPQTSTADCSPSKAEDAQFAEQANPRTTPKDRQTGSEDCTLTIATPEDMLEDCYAQAVISALESSSTIQNCSNGQQCTCGHKSGKRVLISKPQIFGYGLNLQHCSHMTFFPSHSFEQYYQAVRRSWRFGQKNTVRIDVISSEGESGVVANMTRKADQALVMFAQLVKFMNDELKTETTNKFTQTEEIPQWL